jgi:hypothetical protein
LTVYKLNNWLGICDISDMKIAVPKSLLSLGDGAAVSVCSLMMSQLTSTDEEISSA